MKICPNCKAENKFDGAQFCRDCGAPLGESVDSASPATQNGQRDNDFVVTEAAQSPAPSMVTGEKDPSKPPEDDLDIKSTASLLDDDAVVSGPLPEKNSQFTPIGESAPPPPPVSDYEISDMAQKCQARTGEVPAKDNPEFKKLSADEVAAIQKNLYGASAPTPPKAANVNAPVNHTAQEPPSPVVRPIEDPAQMPGVQKANKVRGVAFFHGNFIQLVGNAYLHPGDEMAIGDRHYMLRPKKISRKMAIGIFAGILAVVLIVVGLQLIGPTVSGDGEIIGIVLDANHQPYLEGARISIPSLNKTTRSNAQGFFRFELIPTGTYDVVYELGPDMMGRSNATVTSGQVTLTTFGDSKPVVRNTEPAPARVAPSQNNRNAVSSAPQRSGSGTSANEGRSDAGYGNIRLQADVADARLTVDDKVLGAGNNTYTRIKSGMHKIKVDKDGYQSYSAVINIESNQTSLVNAALKPSATASTSKPPSADDFYARGNNYFSSKDYAKAIDEYTRAINLAPNMREAYAKRAEACVKIGDKLKAVDDYNRVGEIYRFANNPTKAIEAFSASLTYAPENKVALVGRGGARIDNGEYRSALADFEVALKQDGNFYPALFGGGLSQFKLGNNKQADKYFKTAYKVNPADPYLYQYMMLNYLALDDIKNLKKVYAEYKAVAPPAELAEFRSSSRFAPIMRLVEGETR
ncbi:hypothetical protein TRIP_C21610 [Candidatus Zixiibacteriota bacterium]|nr:hypothetical protein TRIP_C21610 [candidate division Zixibacteria bacterium]